MTHDAVYYVYYTYMYVYTINTPKLLNFMRNCSNWVTWVLNWLLVKSWNNFTGHVSRYEHKVNIIT